MVEKILLAIDESVASSRAIEVAAGVGLRYHAEVVVMEVRGKGARHDQVISSEALGGEAPLVDRVVMELKDRGVSARPELWLASEDDVAVAVAHLVRHEGVDLILMGDRAADVRRNGSPPDTLADRVRELTRTPLLLVP